MLLQVGGFGEGGEREALTADGGKQKDFGVARFRVGREHGARANAVDGLGKDDVAGREIDLDVFLGEVELGDAVAQVGVEGDLFELAGEVSGGGGGGQGGDQEKEGETTEHIISVAGTVRSGYGSDRCEQKLGCDMIRATFSSARLPDT
jgi:hypothetical protein